MKVPAVSLDEIMFTYRIICGVSEGRMASENPENLPPMHIRNPDGSVSQITLVDNIVTRALLEAKKHSPNATLRIMSLFHLIDSLPETAFDPQEALLHTEALETAASCPLKPGGFNLQEFLQLYNSIRIQRSTKINGNAT